MVEDTDYRRFADYGFGGRYVGGARNFLCRRGLTRGEYFRGWLGERFADKLGSADVRFGDPEVTRNDLQDVSDAEREQARYRLRVIASDVTSGRMLVLPDDIEDYEDEAGRRFVRDELTFIDAVRMSMSFPFFFEPVRLHRQGRPCYIVDGGLLSNFPVWLFDSPEPTRPTWGFQLHSGEAWRRRGPG